MKIDLGSLALTIGISVVLIDIFFSNIFLGYNIQIILIALGLVLFAVFKKKAKKVKIISSSFLSIVIIFSVYLVTLSIVGLSDGVSPFFYYGFWMVFGILIGFRLCSYLYEKGNKQETHRAFCDKSRLN
ncbi:MAG: hypothetical protein HOP30_08430 [Cyclobacteriaceae bacterium]|nr:hypothetical protein [Cyclobacteriaceae bacterium]